MGILMRVLLCLPAIFLLCQTAGACNIADILFGKVRIEQILSEPRPGFAAYEIGIIFGGDFDSKRFSYDRILGRISPPERDGSRSIRDVTGDFCGTIQKDMSINLEGLECGGCSKEPISLRSVTTNAFAVVSRNGDIMGTISGRLPDGK